MTRLVEGIGVSTNGGGLQAAIEKAGASYFRRFGLPPTHVVLPADADPSRLRLWSLVVVQEAHYAGPVIVGRPTDG
jgi:hypothetical protein